MCTECMHLQGAARAAAEKLLAAERKLAPYPGIKKSAENALRTAKHVRDKMAKHAAHHPAGSMQIVRQAGQRNSTAL